MSIAAASPDDDEQEGGDLPEDMLQQMSWTDIFIANLRRLEQLHGTSDQIADMLVLLILLPCRPTPPPLPDDVHERPSW